MEKGVSIFLVLLFAASCYSTTGAGGLQLHKEPENLPGNIEQLKQVEAAKSQKLQTQAFESG
jgi:hypothetical protein